MPAPATDQGFYAELLAALDEGVAATDTRSRITFWNRRAEELLGWTVEEALGRPALDLLGAEPSEGTRDQWFASVLCSGRQAGELECRRRDGSRVFVDARWTVLGEPGAPPSGVLVSMRDATERRHTAQRDEALAADNARLVDQLKLELAQRTAAEQALRASERLLRDVDRRKNEFLAALSHELRNPLAPIRTSLYVLDHCPTGSPEASRAFEIIGRQVGLMTRLVDDLLDLTRVARGKITLDIGECELNEVTRRVVEDQRAAFERAGVALELEPSSEPVRVRADRQRLAQVLGNLLQNAAKFTPGGGTGRVCVRAQPDRRLATLVVEDTGVGMTAETMAGIFEPFMQAEATRDRSRGGLGLGLALVKSLVEQQGGRVSARSAGPGRGSAFEVELPLVG